MLWVMAILFTSGLMYKISVIPAKAGIHQRFVDPETSSG